MPLYPQYSAATSGSSIKEWKDILMKIKVIKLKQVRFLATQLIKILY